MEHLILPEGSRIYLDTSPIIFSVEKNLEYFPLLLPIWEMADAGRIRLITSELTLLETLVFPLRKKDRELTEAYEELLTNSDVELVPITTDILYAAAHLRAENNIKTPDAIHIATAGMMNCDRFITNDLDLRRMISVNVVLLCDLIS